MGWKILSLVLNQSRSRYHRETGASEILAANCTSRQKRDRTLQLAAFKLADRPRTALTQGLYSQKQALIPGVSQEEGRVRREGKGRAKVKM